MVEPKINVGITNKKNRCAVISIIQALFHIKPFVEILSSEIEPTNILVNHLVQLYENMVTLTAANIGEDQPLKGDICNLYNQFIGDIKEVPDQPLIIEEILPKFLLLLTDNDLDNHVYDLKNNITPNDNIDNAAEIIANNLPSTDSNFTKLFQYIRVYALCDPGEIYLAYEYNLVLNLSPYTDYYLEYLLDKRIHHHFNKNGDNYVNILPNNLSTKQIANKSNRLLTLPKIFIITTPSLFDINYFAEGKSVPRTTDLIHKVNLFDELAVEKETHILSAVIEYASGHYYTSYVEGDKWYRADDAAVYRVHWNDVINDENGNLINETQKINPYNIVVWFWTGI
jgi:hypothetical protein